MLKRKIMNKIRDWDLHGEYNVLYIVGARQIGKTYIIKQYANENYSNVIYLDFIKNPRYSEIFEEDLVPENIYKRLTLYMNINGELDPSNTIIILDEIQECERALMSLKYLEEDKKYKIIASGSLLGVTYKRISSFPVGSIDRLHMHSLDFEEFLWAKGVSSDLLPTIKEYYENLKTVPEGLHNMMLSYFKEYIVVGGMPKAINSYISSNNFNNVRKVQSNTVEDYREDVIKYAIETEKQKIVASFDSIPSQLAKVNKKFQYTTFDKKGTYEKYKPSLQWLIDADIVLKCNNLNTIDLPLESNKIEEVFKIYMKDTGLLISKLENGSQADIIEGNLGIYKGAIYENIIADIFAKNEKELYYFEKNSTLEMDFIIRYKGKATAVEVKSSDNTKSKSMKSLIDNYGLEQGIKLSMKNVGISEDRKVISLPIYMAIFL